MSLGDRIRVGRSASVGRLDPRVQAEGGQQSRARRAGRSGRVRVRDASVPTLIAFVEGIDVSSFQETIDWGRVADEGIVFSFIKATEGATGRDARFEAN